MAGGTSPLSDPNLPSTPEPNDGGQQPEVRLELTRAGVQEVLSLYSQDQRSRPEEARFTIRLEDVERAIRERRRMLVLGLVGGIAFALLVVLASTPLYPVSAQVVLERHDVTSRSASGGPGDAGSAFIATQAEVMQSHSVIADAVGTLPRASHLDEDDDPVADALGAVRASPVSGTQVVALGYLGPDVAHGIRLLNAIVEAYRRALQRNEEASQREKLRAKQAEIEVLDEEATELETRLTEMRRENETFGSAEDTAAAQNNLLRDLAQQITDTRNERITLENRLATGPEQIAILDPATRTLQQQLWEAEAELSRVRLTLKPRHPAVEAAQREVSILQRQLRENRQATPGAIKRDIEAAKGLEEQLAIVYEQERQRMTKIEADRRQEGLLLAELDRVRELGNIRRSELLDQRLVTRLAEAGEVGVTARIIEAPIPPESAAWPRPKLLLVVGAALGLVAGFVAAFVSLRRETIAEEQAEETWVPPSRAGRSGIEVR